MTRTDKGSKPPGFKRDRHEPKCSGSRSKHTRTHRDEGRTRAGRTTLDQQHPQFRIFGTTTTTTKTAKNSNHIDTFDVWPSTPSVSNFRDSNNNNNKNGDEPRPRQTPWPTDHAATLSTLKLRHNDKRTRKGPRHGGQPQQPQLQPSNNGHSLDGTYSDVQ